MSYFSLFGDSLNTALSAVGNIVAPVDEEGLDVGDESRSGRGWGDAFDIAEEDEHDAMEDEGPIALNGDHEDAGEQIRRHGETQNDLASRDGNSYEDVKQLQDALEDRDARIADLQRYNGKLERRVDELEEQVRFLDGKEKSLGIELAEARRAGESAIALARGEKSKVEAELREQLDRSLDEWTRAEERVRELEAALAVALAETELLRAQSNGLSAPAEGNGRSEERLGRAEGENIEAVKAIHNFASLTLKMLENVLSRSPVDVSLQTVLGALGEPSNEESTLLASRLLESIYEVENKVKAAEKGLYQGRSLDASILAPLASALGADASTITDQALVDAACLRLRKEDTNLRTAEAEQEYSKDFVLQLETSLTHRDQVINDLSTEMDNMREELHSHQAALSAAKEREATIVSQCSALHEQVLSLSDALKTARSEVSAAAKSSGDETELRNAKAQVQKMEHEQRQLHQVIAQLRQARKSNREDADSLVAERDALRRDADLLHSENANIKFSLAEKQQEAEVLTRRLYELSTSFDQLSSELSRLRDENKSLFEKYDERDSRCKQLTKALFDAESKLELLQSDLAMMKQDLDFKSTEVQNLNLAIDGLEKESDRRIASANVDFEARLERLSKEHHNNVLALERSLMQQVSNLQASLAESKQREVDEGLLRRKAEMEWVAERKRLQTAVESAMRKLQNSSEDVVDRAVVANLIVSYFRKRKSKDILELISRMLQFTEEQKVVVGLVVAPPNSDSYASEGYVARQGSGGGGGVLTSILGGFLGGHSTAAHPEGETHKIKGDSLAEMWVNFLLEESGGSEDGGTTDTQPAAAVPVGADKPSGPQINDKKNSFSRPDPIQTTSPPLPPTRDSYSSFVMTPESPKVA